MSQRARQIAETRSARATWAGMLGQVFTRGGVRVGTSFLPLAGPWPPPTWKAGTPARPPDEPDQASSEDDDRERAR
jgi:hypothetical protein